MVRELRATMKEVTRNTKKVIRCMTLEEICIELMC